MNEPTPEPERLSRKDIVGVQSQRLADMLQAIDGANPFWTERFRAASLDVSKIDSLDALLLLPTITKTELADDHIQNPPYGTNLTFRVSRYSRLHQTSGTTGEPMRWLDTPESWDWIMRCWEQIFRIVGLSPDDRIAVPFSFGPFLGFWGAFEGGCRLGNLCLPGGGMNSQARLRMIEDNAATIVCCTPTYALRLAEVADEMGIDLAAGSVRALIVAGEPGGSIDATRSRIESKWGARVFDHWGMTDVGALAIESIEDPASLLVLETECIAEIIDTESGEPVEPGTMGELVITNLGRIGSPLIRYRTGDLVVADTEPNSCGRELLRLKGGILGRCDDMLTIRGNNVFPSSIEAIVRRFDDVAEYRVVVETRRAMQHLTIEVEPTPGTDAVVVVEKVSSAIGDQLSFRADVVPVPVGSLPRFELKGRRFHRKDAE